MIKLGMPQLFEYENIVDNFKLAQKLDLDFIEFNLNFNSCRKGLEDGSLKELVKKYNIGVTLHFFDEADFGLYEEVTNAYLSLLEKYASLGKGFVKQINVHLNPGPVVTISGVKNYVYEKEYADFALRLLNALKMAKKICEESNINLVIENTDNLPDQSFVKKIYPYLLKEGFRFCYDIGHDHLCHDMIWKLNEEYHLPFDEFHIHDAKDRKTCHLELGQGELDILKFKKLADNNNAYVVLEVKQESDVINSIKAFRNM